MASRFTQTEKWDDRWFRLLPPYQKLLWNYLCDKCDLAGFWEVDLELAQEKTLIPKTAILGAFQGLNRGYIVGGRYVWLRRFIEHQRNLPLNPENSAHKNIINLLKKHQPSFSDVDFYKQMDTEEIAPEEGLVSPISISKGICKGTSKGKGKLFVPPNLGEIKKYLADNPKLPNVDAEVFFKYFNDGNPPWTDSKGNPVKSWKQKIITWSNHSGQKPASPTRRNLAETPASAYGTEIEM